MNNDFNFSERTWRLIPLIFIAFLIHLSASAQDSLKTISGRVSDVETRESVVGAVIQIKGTETGTTTDIDGNFSFTTKAPYPIVITISYVGYEKQEVTVTSPSVNVDLKSDAVIMDEVVVSSSRIAESEQKSPVAVEKLDQRAIKNSAAPTFYDALENVKGVQMTTSSLTFKVPNTRGFNIPNNFRFMQLVDGVDMQAATLGVPLGNAIGPTELDIESVEITPGAASALYGMNAINGMANMVTKSPFNYQGVSAYQKIGVNHVDGIDRDPGLINETSLRIAKAFNNKFAFKLNGSYFRGTDWVSNTRIDQNPQPLASANPNFPELSGANNPAADLWTVYGDERSNNVPVSVFYKGKDQTFNVRRTGYNEKDLVNPIVENIKFDGALHYKFNSKLEGSYSYRYGKMDGVFQRGNKIQLDNVTVQSHKIELKSDALIFRSYVNLENTGKSYNLKPLADNLDLSTSGSNTAWGEKFKAALQDALNNGVDLPTAMKQARTVADQGRLTPGTPEFNALKNEIITSNNWDHSANVFGAPKNGGAWLTQKSRMYHSDLQYNFAGKIKFIDLLVGADYRVYQVIPDGNNFVDFSRPVNERTQPGGDNVYYTKFGGFAQVTKRLLDERLKLVGSLRYDKNLSFKGKFNPRIAAVYTLKEKHNIRASYQNGYRFPALFEALSFLNNTGVRRVGGLEDINKGLGYLENSYTLESVDAFNAAVNADVAAGYNRNQAALKNRELLQKTNLNVTVPEEINSFEVGYKSILFNNKLNIDWDAYFNIYKGFLGQVEVAVPTSGNVGSDEAVLDMVARNNQTRYRVFTNAKNVYKNLGSSIGVTYNFWKKYTISGNVNYNDLLKNDKKDIFITAFNTPKWITNATIGNREVVKNVGFSVTWKRQSSFFWESTLANGEIPSYNTFDAQVNYRLPKLLSTIKLGGTNIFNNRYIQYAAGPTIGALYYISVTVDGIGAKL
jgi:outer membrane receptor protein involved in Fe transport